MIQIRKDAFETNSSSMHCIILAEDRQFSELDAGTNLYGQDDIIGKRLRFTIDDIDFSDMGKPRVLSTWTERLAYVLAYMYTVSARTQRDVTEINKKITKIVKAKYPSIKTHYPMVDPDEDPYDTYFINHQSQDVLPCFMQDTGKTWEDVVFDDNILIFPWYECYEDDVILDKARKLGADKIISFTRWDHTYPVKDGKVIYREEERQ